MVELREALAIQEHDVSLDEDDLMSPESIVQMGGSLVTHEKETGIVRFSHEQVQDFLKTRYLNSLLTELDLAKICLTFLLFDIFEDGPASDEDSLKTRLEKNPFARYAAHYWGSHIQSVNAENDAEIQDMLARLSQSRNKLDAIAELSIVERAADWSNYSWDRGKTLFHILAENGMTMLAKDALNADTKNVSILFTVH
jgi:hypothetical protein